nr:MAG TPA: hypothetical protein [Caudoviricetes sp.]
MIQLSLIEQLIRLRKHLKNIRIKQIMHQSQYRIM